MNFLTKQLERFVKMSDSLHEIYVNSRAWEENMVFLV